jgi:acyl carrier protein
MREVVETEQGIQIIRGMVAQCLARDIAEVQPHSRLVTDLGADSLDFVDLIFTVEKRFGIRIRENDLNLMSRPDAAGPNPGANLEFLPAETVTRLTAWLPEMGAFPDSSQIRPVQVLPLVTVAALWRLIEYKAESATDQNGAQSSRSAGKSS